MANSPVSLIIITRRGMGSGHCEVSRPMFFSMSRHTSRLRPRKMLFRSHVPAFVGNLVRFNYAAIPMSAARIASTSPKE